MPDDVGGLSVSLRADAGQLRSELQRLEQQLRRFDSQHGAHTVRIRAQVDLPGNRALLDVRRDLSRRFTEAGAVRAKVQLEVPSDRALSVFARGLQQQLSPRPFNVDVLGHFKWGTPPPESINVEVRGGGGGGAAGGGAAPIINQPRTAEAAEGRPSVAVAVPAAGKGGGRGGAQVAIQVPTPQAAAGEAAPEGRQPAVAVSAPSARRARAAAPAARAPSANTARAAAERPVASTQEVFRDWSNEDLLGEVGTGSVKYQKQVAAEMERRDLQSGGARGLTGGMTGQFGPTTPRAAHYSTTGAAGVPAARVAGMARAGQLTLSAAEIYDPYTSRFAGKPLAGKPVLATAGGIAKSGLTEAEMAEHLRRALDKATPAAVQAGMGWYQRAGRLTQSLGTGTGLGRTNIAAATAVFSSQAAWEKNVRNAQNFFDAIREGASTLGEVLPYMQRAGKDAPTKENVQKALDVAYAPGEEAIERRLSFSRKGSTGGDNPKIREFWRGLMGDPTAAVVDRHMAMLMSGGRFKNPSNQGGAQPFQNAIRTVARERGMSAADTQAVAWSTILGPEIAGADPHRQLAATPGGARGFAAPVDPYGLATRRQQRESMRQAQAAKIQPAYDYRGADRYTALAPLSDEQVEARNARLAQILPTGGARGLTGGLPEVQSLAEIEALREQGPLYARWTPDLARDMRPGARSRGLWDRTHREAGISAHEVRAGGEGIDRQYDLGGKTIGDRTFAPRAQYLLRGKPVGEGYDFEPVLEPTSIRPVARVGEAALAEAMRAQGFSATSGAPGFRPYRAVPGEATGGARGYTGEPTWAERLQNMRARPLDRPLQLSRSGRFAAGEDVPVEQVDPRQLLPFRELDRERSPRLQPRRFESVGESAAHGRDYLDRLTEEIRQAGKIEKPLRLEYDEEGFAQLTDGNHRLAASLRLLNRGLEQFARVPVQAFPARGELTGNTARAATPGATTAAGIVGGARGLTGSDIDWTPPAWPREAGINARPRGDFLYHSTNRAFLPGIRDKGVVTNPPERLGLTEAPDYKRSDVSYWTARPWWATVQGRGMANAMLRTRRENITPRPYDRERTEETSRRDVPPELLELWDQDKRKWGPLVPRQGAAGGARGSTGGLPVEPERAARAPATGTVAATPVVPAAGGGARGYTGSLTGAPYREGLPGAPEYEARRAPISTYETLRQMGGPAGVGWEAGDVGARLEAEARQGAWLADLHARVQKPWGGATWNPYTQEHLETGPGRQRRYVAAVGETASAPLDASLAELAAVIQEARSIPANAKRLAAGAMLGVFRDEDLKRIDVDVVDVLSSRREARRHQNERAAAGLQPRGAWTSDTGEAVWAAEPERAARAGRQLRAPAGTPGGLGGTFTTAEKLEEVGAPLGDIAYPEAARGRGMETPAYMRPIPLPAAPDPYSNIDVPAIERRRAAEEARAAEAARIFPGAGTAQAAERETTGTGQLTEAGLLTAARNNPGIMRQLGLDIDGDGRQGGGPPSGGNGGGPPNEPPNEPPEDGDGVGRRLPRGFGEPRSRFAQDISSFAQAGRYAIQEARSAGQVRAVGTTAASQLSGLLGRGADVARVNQMTSVLTKLERLVIDNDEAFANLEETRAEFGEGSEEFQKVRKNLEPVTDEVRRLQEQFNALQPNKLLSMARGMTSAIGGTIVGLGIFGAVTSSLTIAGEALAPVIERITGYNTIASKLTGTLSDQTRQLNGWTEGALAAHAATIGLSAETAKFVDQQLSARVAGEASNKNLSDQIDLFQSSLAVRRQNEPYGGLDRSLFETTGGLNFFGVQTPLFGTPSAQELLGRQLGEQFGDITTGATFEDWKTGRTARIPQGGIVDWKTGRTPPGGTLGPELAQQAADFTASVDMVNEALDRGSDNAVRFAANTEDLSDAQAQAAGEAADRQAELAERAGAGDLAEALRMHGGRLLIEGLEGGDTQQIGQIRQLVADWQRGGLLPDPAVFAQQMMRPLSAAIQQVQYQGNLQRETQIPGQTFLNQLATGRFTAQGQRRGPGGSSVITEDIARQFGADLSGLTSDQEALNVSVETGRNRLREFIAAADSSAKVTGPKALLSQFDALTDAAATTANTIRDINVASSRMQMNLQVRQINEQLRTTGQALADARSFISGLPSAGPGGGQLGVLQFQARQLEITQAELGFAQQALSLALNQRQINFQRASAGFLAPGATGEERAARIAEAKAAADIAQQQQDLATRQLDTSRAQFGVGQEMITVQAARAVETLNIQLGILQEQARVTVQVFINTERVEALQATLQEQYAQIESVVQEAYGITNTFQTHAAQMTAAIGGAMSEHAKVLVEGFSDYLSDMFGLANSYAGRSARSYRPPGTSGGYVPEGTSGGPRYAGLAASGFYGTVSGATTMTMGEAGPETVAILRNPRSMTFSPSGGGAGGQTVINVTVSGNTIGGDTDGQDLEQFAAQIARRVEETLNRRASLLNLRTM